MYRLLYDLCSKICPLPSACSKSSNVSKSTLFQICALCTVQRSNARIYMRFFYGDLYKALSPKVISSPQSLHLPHAGMHSVTCSILGRI